MYSTLYMHDFQSYTFIIIGLINDINQSKIETMELIIRPDNKDS